MIGVSYEGEIECVEMVDTELEFYTLLNTDDPSFYRSLSQCIQRFPDQTDMHGTMAKGNIEVMSVLGIVFNATGMW